MKPIFSCAALALLLAGGCGQSSKPPGPASAMQTVRTDAAPIEKRLSKLGKLQSVWWISTQVIPESRWGVPGQASYKVVGLAQLENEKAGELSQQFQWQRMPPDWKPALTVTNLNLDSAEWSRSAAFTKDCKPQQIPGQLFFERQKGIVYFDLEIE